MPSITLSNLSWSTPDGRAVLSGLDLSFTTERSGLVGRNGTGKTTLLKLVAGELTPHTGRIARSGTLGVLRQSVQPPAGATAADLFGVANALAVLDRAARGAATLDELAEADWTLEERLAAALARVGANASGRLLHLEAAPTGWKLGALRNLAVQVATGEGVTRARCMGVAWALHGR